MASIINASSTGSGGLISTGDASGVLQLQNNGSATLTMDTSGNVGIGTSSPQGKLAISAAGAQGLEFLTLSATSIGIQSYNRSTSAYIDQAYVGSVFTWTTGGVGERMRIDSSGNLLVGTTSTLNTSKFSVYNNVAGNYCTGYKSTKDGSNASYFVSFQNDANSLVGYIVSANQTGTNYTSVSDYRLKEDVNPMTGALDKVALLKPCTYKWKVNGSDGQGFIAHELAEVCPDAVTGEKDGVDKDGNPDYQGIDTSFLVATLTAAIQELKAEVDALKAGA